jgi:hypothetical protein
MVNQEPDYQELQNSKEGATCWRDPQAAMAVIPSWKATSAWPGLGAASI